MIDLSIIIVNYKVKELLRQCLNSIYDTVHNIEYDIWIIDNASNDGSIEMIRNEFSSVNLIANSSNIGFPRACNQALKLCNSRYVLLLNPDVVLKDNSVFNLVDFLNNHKDVGIVGGKGVYPNGRIQQGFKRSFPTLSVAFYRFIGLSRLFPKSKRFAKYNLTYLPDDIENEVDSVSGCFMMIRREVIEQIGLLDEHFFMYGEDLDYCYRAKESGWKIFYVPSAEIIHYHRQSSRKNKLQSLYAFYHSMLIFYKKHWSKKTFFIINWFVYLVLYFIIGTIKALNIVYCLLNNDR